MWFDRPTRPWEKLPDDQLIRRLALPEGRLDMVLDTDTYNEVDDQFALCYALLSPERLNVRAVYAAPFFNDRSTGPRDGMERSYGEIVRLLGLLGLDAEGFAFRGSDSWLEDGGAPVDSPAARDLVRRAMAREDGDLLYVVAIGAITNVASAILMEPRITKRIAVIWLGGNPTGYPNTSEFNLAQDLAASRVVLDCGVPLTLIPCMGVASHMLTTAQELRACIGGKNALCDALAEQFCAYSDDHFAWGKEIWDIAAIGYMLDPEWVPSKLTHSPLVTDDHRWASDGTRHFIREAYFCRRNPIFRDMFRKLTSLKGE